MASTALLVALRVSSVAHFHFLLRLIHRLWGEEEGVRYAEFHQSDYTRPPQYTRLYTCSQSHGSMCDLPKCSLTCRQGVLIYALGIIQGFLKPSRYVPQNWFGSLTPGPTAQNDLCNLVGGCRPVPRVVQPNSHKLYCRAWVILQGAHNKQWPLFLRQASAKVF